MNRQTPSQTWRVDLPPGNSFSIPLGSRSFSLAVPSGPEEFHSLGSLRITDGVDFDSGAIERAGGVETVFRRDANEDGQDDATIVIRSAGSGGYISILSLLSSPGGYRVFHLPHPPGELTPAYQGHDRVTVSGTTLTRSYPSYVDRSAIRIDRQWSPTDLVKSGSTAIKASPDSNAAPSGSDEEIHFSFLSQTWK